MSEEKFTIRCAICGMPITEESGAFFDERPDDTYETNSYKHVACYEEMTMIGGR